LGQADPDIGMGGAIMCDIIGLPECPTDVLEKALASGEQHLIKLVKKKKLLAELNSDLTEELFARCMVSRDGDVQRELLARAKLSRDQLEQLAKTGANRAVRNMATARLRFKRDL
jgi:hypothetical protein